MSLLIAVDVPSFVVVVLVLVAVAVVVGMLEEAAVAAIELPLSWGSGVLAAADEAMQERTGDDERKKQKEGKSER